MNGRKSLEPLLVVLIPKVDNTIRPNCGKRPKLIVKTNAIHCKNIGILTMTLEGKRFFPGDFGNILYTHASLDTPHSVTSRIRKGRNAPTLELQRALFSLMLLRLTLDIVSNDMTTGARYNHQTVPHVQVVTFVGQLQSSHWILLSGVPEFEHVVPTSGYNHIGAGKESH
jgi:hypothetical protein